MTRYTAYLIQGMSQMVEFDTDITDPDTLEELAWNLSELEPNISNNYDTDGDGAVHFVRKVTDNGEEGEPVAGALWREAQAKAAEQAAPAPVAELVPPAARAQTGHPELPARTPIQFLPVHSVPVNQADPAHLTEHGIPTSRAAVQVGGLVIHGEPQELIEFGVALTHAASREQWRLTAEQKRA